MNAADRLIDVAAAVADGSTVNWGRAADLADRTDHGLLERLHLIERIAAAHASLPPVETFEHSLCDSLIGAAATADAPGSPAPTRWGPLAIVSKIGRGTYADVYRAVDPRLDRPVALKLLRHREADGVARESEAIEEARLLARIRHHNVVAVYGAERIDSRVGIWMELVDGQTLEEELRDRGPFPTEELVAVGTALCRALSAVHGAGLLHRDVKAQNAMRDRDGRVLLTDFGTGREVASMGGARELAGTPLYLAPELLNGGQASVATDMYSLGVLLYHLASGSFPTNGRSLLDLRDAHARGAHVPLQESRPDLPAQLASAIDRAATIDAADRYESARACEAALVGAVDPGPLRRRRRLAALAAAAIVMSVPVFEIARWWIGGPPSPKTIKTTQLTFNTAQIVETASAISPDGRYLAYADANGLTVKTLLTNDQRRIAVPGDAIDQLMWFPDSNSLLAHDSEGTWRTTASGEVPRKLAAEGRLSVSPDGLRFAMTNAAGNSIHLLTVEEQDLGTIVPPSAQLRVGKAVWSPDAKRIAYWAQRRQQGGGLKAAIESCRLDGSGTTVLVSGGGFGSGGFAWSSDGRVFFSRAQPGGGKYTDLWEVRVDATTGQPLGEPTMTWQPQDVFFGQPTMTADGKSLVFLLNRFKTNVYVADFDSKTVVLSGLRQAVLADSENQPDAWTPRGDALLFESNSKWNGIYRQSLDQQEPQPFLTIPKTHVFQAVVSPDTRSIFYLAIEPQKSVGPLMRVAAAGGAPEALFALHLDESWLKCSLAPESVCLVSEKTGGRLQLTSFDPGTGKARSHFELPASPTKQGWDLSPDGRTVVSLDVTGPSVRLLLLDVGTQTVRTLRADSLAGAEFVAWRRDGRGWIVTRSIGRLGSEVLYVDGSGGTKMLWKSAVQQLSMPMVSPDGTRIAFGSYITESSVWRLQGF